MNTPTFSLRDGGGSGDGGATHRGGPDEALDPGQKHPHTHAVRAPFIPPADTSPPEDPWLLRTSPHDLNDESLMSDDGNRHRSTTQLRKMIDDFLDHLRYVARQDWNEFRQEELLLAQNRYDWFTEELWRLVLEGKHRTDCDCEVCLRLRVEEDR